MDQILKAHNLCGDDVEPQTLQKCMSGFYTTDDMERIARVSSTNKKLYVKGLPGLLFFPVLDEQQQISPSDTSPISEDVSLHPVIDTAIPASISLENNLDNESLAGEHGRLVAHVSEIALKSMSQSELKAAENAGLTAAEYFVVKGSYGTVLGLDLNMGAYKGAFLKCKTKQAIKLKDDRENSKKFVYSHIIGIAKRKLKSNQIKTLYSQGENSTFIFKTPTSKNIHDATMLLKTIIQPLS